ncbi:MAG TPA: LCP family protein [Nocardioides sp.]|uniref:LCP family protein n=1 Tax=Nocardioides sp. TaxID=35761 RepID=UPI002F414BC9
MSDDWLYGRSPRGGKSGRDGGRQDGDAGSHADPDATRPVPRQSGSREPGPDETRVMPTVARQQRGSAARSPRETPAPPPPPSRAGGGFLGGVRRWGPRWPRPRFRLRYLWLLLLLWLVYLVAVPVFAWNNVSQVNAFPSGHRPADTPGTNYLIVGSDSRKGLTAAQRKQLHTGNDSGQRTDTIMLLHDGSGPSLLMSIPRDSLVAIPGHGTTKINAAFAYGGPKLLIRTIEQLTGIRIDHYVEIGFGGFVNVVDSVGGITICPKHNMDDKLANLHVKKGCQHADGRVALAYARSRHADPKLGDVARGGQQREVVNAVGHKALSPWTFVNPFRYWSLNMSAADSLQVDQDLSVFGMGRFAWGLTHADLNCVVPISNLSVQLDPTRSKQMFKLIRDDDTSAVDKRLCTRSGLPPSAG